MVEVFATLENILKCLEVTTSDKKTREACTLKSDSSNPLAKPKIMSLFPGSCSAVSGVRATDRLALLPALQASSPKKPKIQNYTDTEPLSIPEVEFQNRLKADL